MSSRQERKEVARERREAEEAAVLAASRRRRIQLVGGGVGALAAIAVALMLVLGGKDDSGTADPVEQAVAQIPAQEATSLKPAVEAAGGKLADFDWDYGKSAHTTDPVKYKMNPPTSGPHAPVWAADGNYAGRDTPVVEQLVHALEHGRIEIQYRPGLPAEQVAQLEALFEEDSHHMLLFENTTGLKADVAATAWGHSLVFDDFTPAVFDAIRAFREEYRDKGPEYVA